MEKIKQKRTFKESVKDTVSKEKAYAKKRGDKVKTHGKKYGAALRAAYDIGYARGWDDAYEIPKCLGAKAAAAYGYKKGAKNHVKSDKYIKQYNRGGKKQ